MSAMRVRLLIIGGLALLSTGCADVLGRMEGLPLQVGLDQPLVLEGVHKSAEIGWKLAGGLIVLLGFHCWYRATHGDPWISLLKEYLGGLAVCIAFLTAMQGGGGPVRWILDAGLYLGDQFRPGNHALLVVQQIVSKYSNIIVEIVKRRPEPGEAVFRFAEAWQFYMSSPGFAAIIAINTAAIFVMRLVVQVAYVWLSAFYMMIGPLAVPFVILPQTRQVFVGWLRTLISIALWPWLFALAERLAVAIPYSTWIGTDRWDGSLVTGISVMMQGQLMFLVLNIVFFFVYLGIPAAAYLLVTGAGRAFRGVIA